MHLYLVRHGLAKSIATPGVENDADRPLSPQGETYTRAAAQGFAHLKCDVDCIGSSPLLRSRQTADIFSQALGLTRPVTICDPLATDTNVDVIIEWIRKQPEKNIMLIGHMPSIALLASRLICGSNEQAAMHFRESGLCRLSCDRAILPGTAALDWMVPPDILRALAGE